MRSESVKRKTAETDIELSLNLDGSGIADIQSGVGFLDHMLTLFTRHSGFDLTLRCKGDTEVDDHHSVEDIGICLGKAFCAALGDKRGITRYANMMLPMDEALILAALDISGRSYLAWDVGFFTEKIGNFDTQLVYVFFDAFVQNAGITLHLKKLAGTNSHHVAEGCFKAVGRVLKSGATCIPGNTEIPSSKGVL